MRQSLLVPFAIVIAGAIVACAVYSYFHERAVHITPGTGNPTSIRPVDASDHILGNPAAPVMFVEYSDIDCPFCKNFTKIMEDAVTRYGVNGQVALTYRHLPITTQHPFAQSHAEAAECVAAQGGTAAFFKFIDAVNTAAPGGAQFDPSGYGTIIQKLGLNTDTFASCVQNHTFKKRVDVDATNGIAAGAAGTPYTVLLIPGQPPVSIAGAFSADQVKEIVEAALTKAGVK